MGDPQQGINYTKEVLTWLLGSILGLTRLPKLDAAKRVGISMGSVLEGEQNSITEIPQDREKDWDKQRFLEGSKKILCIPGPCMQVKN